MIAQVDHDSSKEAREMWEAIQTSQTAEAKELRLTINAAIQECTEEIKPQLVDLIRDKMQSLLDDQDLGRRDMQRMAAKALALFEEQSELL